MHRRFPARLNSKASRLVAVLIMVAVLSPATAQRAERAGAAIDPTNLVGRPLAEVLQELREAGLAVVFSSAVVPRSLRVQPLDGDVGREALDPESLLREILAAHDLVAVPGTGDTWIVQRADNDQRNQGSLLGELRSRHTSRPLPLGTVTLDASRAGDDGRESVQTRTNGGGIFRFAGVSPGRWTLRASAEGFEPSETTVHVLPDTQVRVRIDLQPQPYIAEEIAVRPGEKSLLQSDPSAPLAIGREDIESLPHLADDPFRALSLLPGVAAGDLTAQPRVHGGRRDEVQVLLDGQELYEAYHLHDFDSGISVVSSNWLESAHLRTGGFNAERGDRMSGVLDLTTRQPTRSESRLSLSLLTAEAASGGAFGRQQGPVSGSWYGTARLGSIEFANRLFGREDPSFWDAFGKVDLSLSPRHQLRLRILQAGDRLDFQEQVDDEAKGIDTRYDTGYAWATHQMVIGDSLLAETTASLSSIERDRRGFEDEEEQTFEVEDQRDIEVEGIRQQWSLHGSARHSTLWGVEYREFDASFDYANELDREFSFSSDEVEIAPRVTEFAAELAGRHVGAWASHQWSAKERWSFELGVRFDDHELVEFEPPDHVGIDSPPPATDSSYDDSFLSPRLSVALALDGRSVLRASWGLYHQTQRPYELQIENGESQLSRTERANHAVIGYERTVSTRATAPLRALRAEVYLRDIDSPRARFENLFEPFNVFREVEPDRVLVEPLQARAYGAELSLRGGLGSRSVWLLHYALARSEDLLLSGASAPSSSVSSWIPREVDQTHTLNVSWSWRPSKRWSLHLAGRYHTGWPTTPLSGELTEDDDQVLVELGALRSRRLDPYHRLDLRLARRFELERGELRLFLDVQNLYDRQNAAGLDHSVDDGEVESTLETWPGILPSLGISWTF